MIGRKGHGRMRRFPILLVAALALVSGARAEGLTLPQALTEIEAEAFRADTSLVEVIVPEGVVSIGENAFSDCANLRRIALPGSVENLADPFIENCAADLLIQTAPGSAACLYAQTHSLDYQADTVYRALLVSQVYEDTPALRLDGPENDVAAMRACLGLYGNTPYQVHVSKDLTASGMLSAIGSCFADAQPQDVSLFYYSGHGIASSDATIQGALLGADGQTIVTASQLRAALDRIPGRKIVIIDACYSGNMLSASATSTYSARPAALSAEDALSVEAFLDSFISAFARGSRAGLSSSGYFVLTSAASDEVSYEGSAGGQTLGLFTATLLQGCGYDFDFGGIGSIPADANGNGVLTLLELYNYTHRLLVSWCQHVQVYPDNCAWFGLLRR